MHQGLGAAPELRQGDGMTNTMTARQNLAPSVPNVPAVADVDWSLYDFIDLGCSNGGSTRHCTKRFGARQGIGIDIDPGKVAGALAAGFPSALGDATNVGLQKQVRFVSMMNFLEHLPNLSLVEKVIGSAAESATDFLFIRHPSFEGEAHGKAIGFKQFWWDWDHHPTRFRVEDYCGMFDRLGLSNYMVRYVDRVDFTDHSSVLPADAPSNMNKNEAAAYPKVRQPLGSPWWRRQDIFVALRTFEPAEWAAIVAPHARDLAYEVPESERVARPKKAKG